MNENSMNGFSDEPIRDGELGAAQAKPTEQIEEGTTTELQAHEPTGENRAQQIGSTDPLPAQVTPSESADPLTQPEPYLYRWSYEEQVGFDRKKRKSQKKKSAAIYALVMALAFSICLCFLGGVIYVNSKTDDGALTTAEVAELVNPSTVLITASGNGYGSGFFIRSDGYILTNSHVVNGASEILVTMYDGTVLTAILKWSSTTDDLALIKVEGKNFPAIRIGSSASLKIGDTAIAIGNPAGDTCSWSTTQGVISSTAREITLESSTAIIDMTLLQTDAQVNHGNSGGPLCNDRGEVIGIVVRKMTSYIDQNGNTVFYEGLGFAIPIDGAMELVNAYLETGSTANVRSSIARVRPTIGIQAAAVKKGDVIVESTSYQAPVDGILVVGLTKGGPAIGILEAGDIIVEMNGVKTIDMDQLRALLYEHRAGDSVELKINRFGEEMTVTLVLGVASKA